VRPTLLALLLLAGCARGSPQTGAPPGAEVIVQHHGDLDRAIGKRVRVVGTAENAKLSAVVLLDAQPIYCLELSAWPEANRGRRVEVVGLLDRTDRFTAKVGEGGAVSQGTAGPIFVLRQVTFTVQH
jgi:hypothetical protein